MTGKIRNPKHQLGVALATFVDRRAGALVYQRNLYRVVL